MNRKTNQIQYRETNKNYSTGFNIYSREWKVQESKGTIFIIHGYSEYSGKYDTIGNYFAEKGYNVFMPDLPSHGRSSNLPGRPKTYIDSMETMKKTVEEYISHIKNSILSQEDEKGRNDLAKPIFVYGHSMGGLISSMLAVKNYHKVDGYILSSPGLILNLWYVYTFWYFWYILLFFLPNLVLGSPVESCSNKDTNDNDKKVVENDPYLFAGRACAKTSFEIAKSGYVERDRDLDVPVLLLHGDADVLVNVNGSRIKAQHLKNSLSQYIEYPGANHVLLEEKNHMEIIKTIEEWIVKVCKSKQKEE